MPRKDIGRFRNLTSLEIRLLMNTVSPLHYRDWFEPIGFYPINSTLHSARHFSFLIFSDRARSPFLSARAPAAHRFPFLSAAGQRRALSIGLVTGCGDRSASGSLMGVTGRSTGMEKCSSTRSSPVVKLSLICESRGAGLG